MRFANLWKSFISCAISYIVGQLLSSGTGRILERKHFCILHQRWTLICPISCFCIIFSRFKKKKSVASHYHQTLSQGHCIAYARNSNPIVVLSALQTSPRPHLPNTAHRSSFLLHFVVFWSTLFLTLTQCLPDSVISISFSPHLTSRTDSFVLRVSLCVPQPGTLPDIQEMINKCLLSHCADTLGRHLWFDYRINSLRDLHKRKKKQPQNICKEMGNSKCSQRWERKAVRQYSPLLKVYVASALR